MKKKLISLAMLVTVFAMQVVGVSAASKTAGNGCSRKFQRIL